MPPGGDGGAVGAHGTATRHVDDYIRIGVRLAGDRSALEHLRSLRVQMAGSPLCDKVRAKVECAYHCVDVKVLTKRQASVCSFLPCGTA
jgi:hypothetical protein